MLFSKKNKDIIKFILFILIICLLIYILLLNYPKITEGKRFRVKKAAKRTVRSGTDLGKDAVDTVGGGLRQGFNELSDYTTDVVGDVTGLVTGLLGEVLNGLQSAVGSLNSKFIQIDDNTNNAVGKSSIFGTNTINTINNQELISEPTIFRRRRRRRIVKKVENSVKNAVKAIGFKRW